jgi:1-phosphofructokinase family hexose kinase
MFLTVTLNPALDKTLCVRQNAPHVTVRASRAIDIAGGKGVNVARALRGLGGQVRALMPLGGHAGQHVADLARAEGIEVASVPVSGQTRTAFTVHEDATGHYWHYLEPGPELSEQELSRLREGFLWALDGCHTVTISGSLPSPSAAPLVAWMVRTARERGVRAALDSFGAPLKPALEAGPWLAKPNVEEWEATTGERVETESDRWSALERMAGWGIRFAVISRGADGAWALVNGERYRLMPPFVEEVSDLGAGDSMVAGICWAAAESLSERECLAWGAACGAANAQVWDPGALERDQVLRLLPRVEIRLA